MSGKIIGIDIGGTNFRIGAVGKDGIISNFKKIPVWQIFNTQEPLLDLTMCLKNYCQGMAVEAVSIGFPATLDKNRKTVLQAPNVPFMENLPVVEVLSESLQVPVLIERDVTMALYHDLKENEIPPHGVVVGIYFGTGIGNAICINGVPLAGCHGTAGELGHIPVDGSDLICGCGNMGCIENLAAGKYLAHLCETVYPQTPIGSLFLEHGNEALLTQFVDRMAIAVAAEVNILDPEYILIGGGIPAMTGFPQEQLVDRIRAHARKPYPANDLHIIFTGDEDAKSVIGAAIYARSML